MTAWRLDYRGASLGFLRVYIARISALSLISERTPEIKQLHNESMASAFPHPLAPSIHGKLKLKTNSSWVIMGGSLSTKELNSLLIELYKANGAS